MGFSINPTAVIILVFRSLQKQVWEEGWGIKNVFSCKISVKLPRKRNFLIVKVNTVRLLML